METDRPAFVNAPPSADGRAPGVIRRWSAPRPRRRPGHDFPLVLVTRPCGHHRPTGQCEAWSIWQVHVRGLLPPLPPLTGFPCRRGAGMAHL